MPKLFIEGFKYGQHYEGYVRPYEPTATFYHEWYWNGLLELKGVFYRLIQVVCFPTVQVLDLKRAK